MEATHLVDEALIRSLVRPRPLDGHKGTFGHALMVAGSNDKAGAAILSSMAALRSGCGLVSVHITPKAITPLLSHLPEAMILPRRKKAAAPPDYSLFKCIGVGPGMGITKHSAALLSGLLRSYQGPLILDADAITLLSQHRDWYRLLGPGKVLTPHPKEFDRLTREHTSRQDRLQRQLEFAQTYRVTVVLKDSRTVIATASGSVYHNTTGNNGMATAGSGDVLTGIITGLCAQGYPAEEAAILGTFLHGYAGNQAAARLSRTCMLASDIIAAMPAFFLHFER